MLLASAVPVNVGVLSDVMLSVEELPKSEAALRSGVVGADGAELSMLIDSADDADEIFPAASVALAVMLLEPEESADVGVNDHVPVLL